VVSVDEMNRKILRFLRTDGKMSYREVAQRLKRSPSTVRDRIGRMESDGIILGYMTLVNSEQMGMNAEAIIFANMDDQVRIKDLQNLSKVQGVLEVLLVSGNKNVMIRVQANDNLALQDTIAERIVPVGLKDIDLRVILESVMRFPEISLPD
jgi:Lrp/AsnC family leucine-responsive transcriptional regulator